MGTVLTYCGIIPDAGVVDFDENFDSCITATLTLFLSNTTPSYGQVVADSISVEL